MRKIAHQWLKIHYEFYEEKALKYVVFKSEFIFFINLYSNHLAAVFVFSLFLSNLLGFI